MKRTSIISILSGFMLAVGLLTPAWSNELTVESLTFFPKPNPITSTPRNYELNEVKTIKYYDDLFRGRSAREVVEFFDRSQHPIIYNSKNEISFVAQERIMTVYSYKVSISLFFDKGIFKGSAINYYGII